VDLGAMKRTLRSEVSLRKQEESLTVCLLVLQSDSIIVPLQFCMEVKTSIKNIRNVVDVYAAEMNI
jgi:hypothetical protein